MNDKSIKILFNLSLIVLIFVSVVPVSATEPELAWYASIGTTPSNEVAYSVLSAEDGGFVIAGSKSNPGRGLDFYLVKTGADGAVQWERSYGTSADDCAYSLAKSSDGGYVLVGYTKSAGPSNSDVLILKTDSTGEYQWNVTFGGARDDVGQSVIKTAEGFVIAGGSRSFNAEGSYDVYIIATDPDGSLLWNRTAGGTDYEYANCIEQTSDGGFIIAGGTGLFLSYVKDFLLIKTDSAGTPQWTKTYGASGPENAYSVIQTSDGGFLLGGYTRSYGGNENAYVVKTDAAGAVEWSNHYGGGSDDRINSVVQAIPGEYLLVGYTRSSGFGLSDVYLLHVGEGGGVKSAKTFGGTNDDVGHDAIRNQDGSCVIVGETRSYIHAPSQDVYLIKTNSFLDSDPPQILDLSPPEGAITNDPTPAISASFEDPSGIDISSVRVYLDSDEITDLCAITSDGFGYSDWGVSALSQGSHVVSVFASDMNGNAGNITWSFFVDSQSPVVSGIMPTNRSSTSSTRPVISAVFSDATGVNTSGVQARLNLMDITPSAQITATGIQYVPTDALSQGLQTVTLIVPDLAGNAVTASWTFRVDSVAPTISSMSPGNGAMIQSFGDSRVVFSASYSDNAEVVVGSIRLTLDGVDITGSATITATSLTCTRDVSPGSHTAQLAVTDGAGNTSTSTVSFTVNNLMSIVVLAAIAFIVLLAVLLLLSRRKKRKPENIPEWEKPSPPPPPEETYVVEQDGEVPARRPEERRYTPPLPVEQPTAKPPEPAPVAEKAPEAAPEQPIQAPGVTIIEGAKPLPTEEPLKEVATKLCPKCGSSNWIGASKCWYCDAPLN